MAGTPITPNTQAELDLLALLLEADPLYDGGEGTVQAYPWNPALPEAEAYFNHLEQEAIALGWFDDLAPYAEALSQTMEQAWSAIAPQTASTAGVAALKARIQQTLSVDVPQTLISAIVQAAQNISSSSQDLEEQLIQCVQGCFSGIMAEDWPVIVRPYAFSMRSVAQAQSLEAALQAPRAEWNDLSEFDQARLSAAIAGYALANLPSESSEAH